MKICEEIVYKDCIITMENVNAKKNWLWGDIPARVEPRQNIFIKTEQVVFKKESDYVKVKLCRNTASATSETNEAALFENG